MFSFRTLRLWTTLLWLAVFCSTAVARIEAVKGKRYTLGPNHGPWMVMVAALRDVPENRRTQVGLTAWEAADELVYELRVKGIPAYTFLQDMQVGELKEFSANAGGRDTRKYIARHEAIAVLAGNFPSPDEKQAKIILNYLKNGFEPAFLKKENSGAILPRTPGRPHPLSRAHMTTNPLMPDSEVKRKTFDPVVRKLNSGEEYSLLKNKGKYTLRIATFRGNSIVQVGDRVSAKASYHFDEFFGANLDESGTKAWELTQALRSASKLGYGQDFEAYVFHDRFKSYVTIGSFDSEQDARIVELARRFRGKDREHEGKAVTVAEVFTIPRNLPAGAVPQKYWMFDTMPKLIRVP